MINKGQVVHMMPVEKVMFLWHKVPFKHGPSFQCTCLVKCCGKRLLGRFGREHERSFHVTNIFTSFIFRGRFNMNATPGKSR